MAASFMICLTGWMLDLRSLAPVWGDVATWVGGLATSSGLIFAGLQIRDSRRQRAREEDQRINEETERREAMARSVSISSSLIHESDDQYRVEYTLMNGADYPIDNVVLLVSSYGEGECDPPNQRGCAAELVIGTMHAKQMIKDSITVRLDEQPPFILLTAMSSVIFTDCWGKSWWRCPGDLQARDQPARMC